jgi:hypothetical protein
MRALLAGRRGQQGCGGDVWHDREHADHQRRLLGHQVRPVGAVAPARRLLGRASRSTPGEES